MNKLIDDFQQNFLDESRWHYLTNGLKTTLIITFFAVILGFVLGFLVAIVRSTHDKTGKMKILNALCRVYLTVIRGTPMVVQLLITYFVIFGSVNIDKTLVAVLAFGVNSGAYVAEIFRSGIMSIDKGQMEAGRSVGLTYAATMRYIIIPQAFKNVLPALGNELITLVKETSVVTVIGLRDLTKGAMIVQSKTYQALVPYLAIAAIYLVIVMFLTWIMGKMERRLRQSDLR